MMPETIKSYEQYLAITEKYGGKKASTNNYLQDEAKILIADNRLTAVCGKGNLFLLVKNNGFSRLYYYINDYHEKLALPQTIITTELIFRGTADEPTDDIRFLEACGLRRHLLRDQYSGVYKSLKVVTDNAGVDVCTATQQSEVTSAFELFNSVFDKYTGDYVSPSHYSSILENGDIYIATDAKSDTAELLGALHRTVIGKVTWLSHVAVEEKARGKHVGAALIKHFIEANKTSENSRYMLWVQHENRPAMQMYQSRGFVYAGKSSLSMIKL